MILFMGKMQTPAETFSIDSIFNMVICENKQKNSIKADIKETIHAEYTIQ